MTELCERLAPRLRHKDVGKDDRQDRGCGVEPEQAGHAQQGQQEGHHLDQQEHASRPGQDNTDKCDIFNIVSSYLILPYFISYLTSWSR